VVVIGLGLAGLLAGLAAAGHGARTLVTGMGHGTLRLRAGTVDVLGYRSGRMVSSPATAMAALVAAMPRHPYALARDDLRPGLEAIRSATAAAGLELAGSLESNQLIATAAGTIRPTCLAPDSMVAAWPGSRLLVVGLVGYRDFQAELVASVLPAAAAAHGHRLTARSEMIDLLSLHRRHLGAPELARRFDQPDFRREVAAAVRYSLGDASLVALPAVLGLERAAEVAADLTSWLGVPVVELATLPPSVPGLRLELALMSALRRAGAALQVGSAARIVTRERWVERVELDAPGHPLRLPVAAAVLASGGLASGGLEVMPSGGIRETVAGLPVSAPAGGQLFGWSFLEPGGHGAGLAGVRVDDSMRPLGEDGEPACGNLFAAGGLVACADRALDRSADGIACATGWRAGTRATA
jgi:glycerol-3-phosphate dehydrogenase subunit B